MTDKLMYAAPMEGLTGFAWRRAHYEVFGGADKYFTPFVVANQTHKFKTKELRDLTQNENNLVPQILTDKSEHFIWAAREMQGMGYNEINFNLGCPSATVTTRGKGSGILKTIDKLDEMLDQIYTELSDMKVSIKTRIGFSSKEEWDNIMAVYNKYPIYELIVHARLREEFYNGEADRDIFARTTADTGLKLIYNGDIETADDPAFTYPQGVMVGRGLLRDPSLFRQAKGGRAASREELRYFHQLLVEYYKSYMNGDGPVIHHLKSLWVYWSEMFEYNERDMKKLKKSKTMSDYMMAANAIL